MGSVAWQVRCTPDRAMELIAEHLHAAGWREVEQRADGHSDHRRGTSDLSRWFERGRLGRSVLLGGLAGGGQHLQMRVDGRSSAAAPSRSASSWATGEVVCSWSDASPRALGGILGERRARRTMGSTTRGLRAALAAAGVLSPRTD
jgi:hypothetical protein